MAGLVDPTPTANWTIQAGFTEVYRVALKTGDNTPVTFPSAAGAVQMRLHRGSGGPLDVDCTVVTVSDLGAANAVNDPTLLGKAGTYIVATLTPAQTAELGASTPDGGLWRLKVTFSAADVRKILTGTFTIEQDVS